MEVIRNPNHGKRNAIAKNPNVTQSTFFLDSGVSQNLPVSSLPAWFLKHEIKRKTPKMMISKPAKNGIKPLPGFEAINNFKEIEYAQIPNPMTIHIAFSICSYTFNGNHRNPF